MRMWFYLLIFYACVGALRCSDSNQGHQYRYESSLNSGGDARTYIVKLPNGYYEEANRLFPIVIALHGTGGSAKQMESSYGLDEEANRKGFVVVYPDGVRSDGPLGIRTWNAGMCCDFAMENNVDDVAFMDKLIDQLVTDYRIDDRRIYVTGMSNGGMMAYRLACELSPRIAAIAPVSSTMMTAQCDPGRAIPILHIHSILDKKIPYSGGVGIGGYIFSSVDSVLNIWVGKNRCVGPAYEEDNGRVVAKSWSNCDGGAVIESLLTYDGGHSWPGGQKPARWADPPSAYVNASELMFEFFQRFSLPN